MNRFASTLTAGLLAAAASWASPISGNSLQNIFNGIAVDGANDVNVKTDYISDNNDSHWKHTASGMGSATMIVELAGYAGMNSFGIFDIADPTKTLEVFGGANGAGNSASINVNSLNQFMVWNVSMGTVQMQTFSSNNFGFYMKTGGGDTWYSDTDLNKDGMDHMMAYQGVGEEVQIPGKPAGVWTPNEYILAWEDLPAGSSDGDYNDMVLMVESLQPIPEPGTIGLLGLGLLGLAFVARRRKS